MSEPKGPKLELPDELAGELEEQAAGEDTDPSQEAIEVDLESDESSDPDADESAAQDSPAARELAELEDRHLRLAAEFENFKRRTRKEREDLHHYANENLIKDLLHTVDNLERALEHAQQSTEGIDGKALLEGVDLTSRSLRQTLERSGVEVIEALGDPFDPQVHEAVQQTPSDEHPAGQVAGVLQKGYRLRERLLRPALVVVSSGSGDDPKKS